MLVWYGVAQSLFDTLGDAAQHSLMKALRVAGNEESVAEGIKMSGVPRSEIWITTKLWDSDHVRTLQRRDTLCTQSGSLLVAYFALAGL